MEVNSESILALESVPTNDLSVHDGPEAQTQEKDSSGTPETPADVSMEADTIYKIDDGDDFLAPEPTNDQPLMESQPADASPSTASDAAPVTTDSTAPQPPPPSEPQPQAPTAPQEPNLTVVGKDPSQPSAEVLSNPPSAPAPVAPAPPSVQSAVRPPFPNLGLVPNMIPQQPDGGQFSNMLSQISSSMADTYSTFISQQPLALAAAMAVRQQQQQQQQQGMMMMPGMLPPGMSVPQAIAMQTAMISALARAQPPPTAAAGQHHHALPMLAPHPIAAAPMTEIGGDIPVPKKKAGVEPTNVAAPTDSAGTEKAPKKKKKRESTAESGGGGDDGFASPAKKPRKKKEAAEGESAEKKPRKKKSEGGEEADTAKKPKRLSKKKAAEPEAERTVGEENPPIESLEEEEGEPAEPMEAPPGTKCEFCHEENNHPVAGALEGPFETTDQEDIWVHENCLMWTPEIYFDANGIQGLESAMKRGERLKCHECKQKGATVGCISDKCPKVYHYHCARKTTCTFKEDGFCIACEAHVARLDKKPKKK